MAPTITDNCEFECATVEATTTSAITIGDSDNFDSSAIGGSGDNFEESNELHLNGQQDQDVQEEQQQQQQMPWEAPGKQGLYDPQNEHEACGVGFIVAIDGKRSHKVRIQHIHPFDPETKTL